MNIGDNHYNLNIGNANTGVNGAGGKVEQGTGAGTPVSGNAQITQIAEGQMFRGQILDITNNQVSIMMDGNKTLLAHMAEAVNMNIGDLLTFMVKENNGSNVVIKPFMDQADMMKDSAIFKVLDQNNFSPTEKNYQIAETLMNNGMPVDKAGMQRIMQQSYKYPDASVDTLVALNKLGIPVNEANISQYEAYMSNSHQITQDIMNLGSAVGDFAMEQMSAMGDGNEIIDFNSNLLATLSDAEDMGLSLADMQAAAAENAMELGMGDASTGDKLMVKPEMQLSGEVASGAATSGAEAAFLNELTDGLVNKLSVDKDSLQQIFSKLMEMGFDKNVLKAAADKSDTAMQLLNNINTLIKNGNEFVPELNLMDIKALLVSNDYKELLESAVKGKMTLKGEDMGSPEELDSLYNKMYDKANRFLETFSGSNSPAGQQLSDSAKGMQERLDFMQNLNQMYAYAQIPVKLSGNDTNSELFVYMNKRHMKDAKEEVSALLHLDMEHLGPTDVHVSLHGTNVHTRFYVEDEESARIIDEHMTMLEKAIRDNGYSLTNEVITREPALATTGNMVVDEMLGKDLEQSVKRYSFDVRM